MQPKRPCSATPPYLLRNDNDFARNGVPDLRARRKPASIQNKSIVGMGNPGVRGAAPSTSPDLLGIRGQNARGMRREAFIFPPRRIKFLFKKAQSKA
jgi:hypothetical protein